MLRITITTLLLATTCLAQDAATLAAHEANEHAFDLFQLFRQMTKGNFCFSPYSGHRVAAMLAEGAKSETQKELLAMAHLDANADVRASHASALRQELSMAGNGLLLQVANSIWSPSETPILPGYLKLAADQFDATAQTLPAGNAWPPPRGSTPGCVKRHAGASHPWLIHPLSPTRPVPLSSSTRCT